MLPARTPWRPPATRCCSRRNISERAQNFCWGRIATRSRSAEASENTGQGDDALHSSSVVAGDSCGLRDHRHQLLSCCNLAPGDAADVLAGEAGAATEAYMVQLRETFGLDQPLYVQLYEYVANIVQIQPRLLVPPQHAGVRPHRRAPSSDAVAHAVGDISRHWTRHPARRYVGALREHDVSIG